MKTLIEHGRFVLIDRGDQAEDRYEVVERESLDAHEFKDMRAALLKCCDILKTPPGPRGSVRFNPWAAQATA